MNTFRITSTTLLIVSAGIAMISQSTSAFPGDPPGAYKTCWHNGSQYAHVSVQSPCPLSSHDSHFVVPGKVAVAKHEPGQYCFYSESDGNP